MQQEKREEQLQERRSARQEHEALQRASRVQQRQRGEKHAAWKAAGAETRDREALAQLRDSHKQEQKQQKKQLAQLRRERRAKIGELSRLGELSRTGVVSSKYGDGK